MGTRSFTRPAKESIVFRDSKKEIEIISWYKYEYSLEKSPDC